MSRVRRLAEHTPASRERFVDLLRAVAIILVLLGHWLVTVIGYDAHGTLTGRSALPYLVWAHPITWLVQVMPIFFLVGGFANAASLAGHPGDAVGWLLTRSARLVRPTTVLMVILAAAGLIAHALGVEPGRVRLAVWFASLPLWFLSAYLAVVLLAPVMYAVHRRFGLAVPLVLVVLVALGDLARLEGARRLGDGSYLFGWLAMHQVGFAWRDEWAGVADTHRGLRTRRLPVRPRTAVPLLVVGLAGLVLCTVLGPYPVSMVNVPGERLHNMSPPTLALLALATAQLGLVLLLRDAADRWLHRPGPWRAVVAVNAVILTVFLWHVGALLLVVGALHLLGLLPTPRVGSATWWLWRLPWLVMSSAVLVVLVAVFARFEVRGERSPRRGARSRRRPDATPPRPSDGAATRIPRPARVRVRAALTVAGFLAVILGLVGNSMAANRGQFLFGMPAAALIAYLSGATLLRLIRAPRTP